MSLWMLLLIVLLTVTAVLFFAKTFTTADDPKAKRRYRIIGTIALVAAVGLVVLGVLRGRSAAAASALVVTKKGGKRVKLENNEDFTNEFAADEFLDDFDDLPMPSGIKGVDKPGSAPATDSTVLLS